MPPHRPARFLLCLIMLGVCVGNARAEVGYDLPYTEERAWENLLDIQRTVPGFAGFTRHRSKGSMVMTPLLVFPNLGTQARAILRDRYSEFASSFSAVAIPARYSVRTLVTAARRIKATHPEVTVGIDVSLNRVSLLVPVAEVDEVARKAGVSRDLLISTRERPELQFQVLVKGRLLAGDELKDRMFLQVRNRMNRPAAFESGCLTAGLTDLAGELVPSDQPLRGCAGSAHTVLQPGQVRVFPLTVAQGNAPAAGQYLIRAEGDLVMSLTVRPR